MLNFSDILENDVVKISREVKVASIETSGFYDSKGRYHRLSHDSGDFTLELIKREPEGFPIQIGDIWLADDGSEWYIFSVSSVTDLRAMTTPHDGNKKTNLSVGEFKPKAVKLMHRRQA